MSCYFNFRYLVTEKKQGFALNPVAHFHLRNGASLWRLNWLGNMSQSGLQQSYGIMVNYRYHLPDINSNSSQYIMNGKIAYSDSIAELLQCSTLQRVPQTTNIMRVYTRSFSYVIQVSMLIKLLTSVFQSEVLVDYSYHQKYIPFWQSVAGQK